MRFTSWRQGALALCAYGLLSVAQSWPLPLHIGTHLTGDPSGDAGVYVWNLWIFSHELFTTHASPLRTMEILPLAGPTDLSLHNYTIFADLLAVPLLPWLDIISTFNVIYLINVALAGFGMFLLARRLTARAPEAFLAGLMFAWAPFLVTRSIGHYSLTAAAPLPFFMLALYRAWETHRLRDAVLTGVALAWASFCDPYHAVYCVILGAAFVLGRTVDVTLMRRSVQQLRAARNLLNVALVLVIGLIVGVNLIGGGVVAIGPARISMRTLYTPMLVLTLLAVARIAIATNLRITALPLPSRAFMVRAAIAAGVVAVLLMSPTLYAVGVRVIEGRMPSTPLYWRSSPPGVDLLSFFAPNPNHPLAPEVLKAAVAAGAGGYVEQVASLSWIGALVLLAAWRFTPFRPGRFWPWLTVAFALMSMGPFLHIAGIKTYVPGPWAVIRYVPLIGAARMPGRMSVVVTMGFCVLVALALAALTRRYPQRRTLLLSAVGVFLVAELLPAPRALFPVEVPRVYQTVTADPRPIRVLTLPTGVRDGVAPIGNFDASTQFYQAFHGKGLVGGYLSRVSARRKEAYRRLPVMGALLDVSEGRTLEPAQMERAINGADAFLKATNLGYVIMNERRVSTALRDLASNVLGLTKIAEVDGYSLYTCLGVPTDPDNVAFVHKKIGDNILDAIGHTPLIRLNRIPTGLISATVLAKIETFNPGNSIKDRMALKMIEDAEKSGKLQPGGTIIEGTSGNTGMGLAIVAVIKGYKCIFTTTDKQSKEKVDALRAFGAEVIVCPTNVDPEDPRSYYSVSSRLEQEVPNSWKANQYDNLSNSEAHYETTGPEIWEQTDGRVTHLVVGVGTGGTICGTGRYLKEKNPAIKLWGIDTYGSIFKKYKETGIFDKNEMYPYVTEGIGEDFLPQNVDFSLIEHFEKVTDKDAAIMTRRIAREEGIFAGNSAGAAMAGLLQLRDRFSKDDVVVVIFHDHGTRYLGKMFNDDWMRKKGYLDKAGLTARDLVASRPAAPLFTLDRHDTVSRAVVVMTEHDYSQIPITDGGRFIGSVSETRLYQAIVGDPEVKGRPVETIMQPAFPFADISMGMEALSRMITPETPAVLVRDFKSQETFIITRWDVIRALG